MTTKYRPALHAAGPILLTAVIASVSLVSLAQAEGDKSPACSSEGGRAAQLSAIASSKTAKPSAGEAKSEMVHVPTGKFIMGSNSKRSMPNERPTQEVSVKEFWMDTTPITNSQFAEFVKATGYVTTAEQPVDWEELKKQLPPGTPKPPEENLQPGSLVFTPPDHPVDLREMANWWQWVSGASWKHPKGPESDIEGLDKHPVVQISWDDAAAYANWAGKRLPTEAEWEYAAHGGKYNSRYVWGNSLVVNGKHMANTFTGDFPYRNDSADGFSGLAPVKSFPANGYGLYGMAGNVWNWTADVYVENRGDALVPDEVRRVVKGGSFLCNPHYCESYRPSARRGTPRDTGSSHVGFRCVSDKPLS